jgi:hypothetical protein
MDRCEETPDQESGADKKHESEREFNDYQS